MVYFEVTLPSTELYATDAICGKVRWATVVHMVGPVAEAGFSGVVTFFALVAVCFFLLFSNDVPLAIFLGTWSYLLGAWGLALYRFALGRRTLAVNDLPEFEDE